MDISSFFHRLFEIEDLEGREKLVEEYNQEWPANPAPHGVAYLNNTLTEEDIQRGIKFWDKIHP